MSEQLRQVESHESNNAEIERAAAERLKQLERSLENGPEQHNRVEAAREQLKQVEQTRPAVETAPRPNENAAPRILTKAANYRQTMVSLRHRMKPAQRSFSEFIHNPVVEATSDVVGKTVLRPSVSTGATTTAFLVAGFLYLYARHYGFQMRGSEIWLSLIAGGVIGLLVEGIYKTVRRMRD